MSETEKPEALRLNFGRNSLAWWSPLPDGCRGWDIEASATLSASCAILRPLGSVALCVLNVRLITWCPWHGERTRRMAFVDFEDSDTVFRYLPPKVNDNKHITLHKI